MTSIASPAGRLQTLTALFLTVAMAAVVGTALGFEHIGGYIPCKLCLEQRIPYYAGVPLMALAALSSTLHWPAWVTRGLLVVGGLLMAWGLFLGVKHAGVEWGWWAGPTDCGAVAAPVDTGGKGVLDALNTFVPPACDTAALRVLGLSFAGWNVIASLILAAIAFRGAFGKGEW
ncbi:disulfide bond formation protein B [Mesorhizobium sp. L-8-3]|uniref:disulfide bond formation protein B n=1 Tax=Mesorhizobium sp. L-8-3 TaxID=2744522 RepID=UPI0019274DED|nr:disulfide bond formation protein B [Mesorhizobium sp. L-8-3]BCH22680.1 disulfide bond formation protein B [Mesorhizobium sp. L-8-3]